MAALGVTHPSLLDLARRLDPNDKVAADIVEILDQMDDGIIAAMPAVEGNLPTGHRSTIRTGIPAATWRKFNEGVQPNKSTTVQITDNCGMLEAYAEVDKALADLNGNTAAFRLSEDLPHIEGLYQEFRQTFFYGNEGSEPEAFTGFSPRFNALSGFEAAQNVINAASNDTDNTSIWLIGGGPNTAHLIYPKGSTLGIQRKDMGEVTLETTNGVAGARSQAYRTHYRWDVGLCVRDWRYVVRIANIEVSDLLATAASGADLVNLMTQALEKIYSLSNVRPFFVANRTITAMLRQQMVTYVKNSTLQMDEVAGKKVMTFDGVPVYRCDALVNTETALV